jgi:hypothetical protein
MPKIFFSNETKNLPFSTKELTQMPKGFVVLSNYPICDFIVKNNCLFDGEDLDKDTELVEFKTQENSYQAIFDGVGNLVSIQLKYKEISKADQKRIAKIEKLFAELKKNGVGWISVDGTLCFSLEMEDLPLAFKYECNETKEEPKFTYNQHEANWQNSKIGVEQIVP